MLSRSQFGIAWGGIFDRGVAINPSRRLEPCTIRSKMRGLDSRKGWEKKTNPAD